MPNHAIVRAGASTAVGRDAWSSAAAVRAGLSGFGEHPGAYDAVGEPIVVARAPWLELQMPMLRRLALLLLPALDEALVPIVRGSALHCDLLLGLPAPRPGMPRGLEDAFTALVRDRYRRWISGVRCFVEGHTSALTAMAAANDALDDGRSDAFIVAGVDSYIEPETLAWLEDEDRLHGAGALNNAWGFIPGEGAGALLLVSSRVAREHGMEPLALLSGNATGFEHKYFGSGLVCIGEGLTEALANVLTRLPHGVRVADVYCDLNGEPFRCDEYGFSALRTGEHFVTPGDFVAAADCWGDVGAAGGVLHVALASVALSKRYAKGKAALVTASADAGTRGAALVTAVGD